MGTRRIAGNIMVYHVALLKRWPLGGGKPAPGTLNCFDFEVRGDSEKKEAAMDAITYNYKMLGSDWMMLPKVSCTAFHLEMRRDYIDWGDDATMKVRNAAFEQP